MARGDLLLFLFAVAISTVNCQDVNKELPRDALDQRNLNNDFIATPIEAASVTNNVAPSNILATNDAAASEGYKAGTIQDPATQQPDDNANKPTVNATDTTLVNRVVKPEDAPNTKVLNSDPDGQTIATNIETKNETAKAESHDLMIPSETEIMKPNDFLVRPLENTFEDIVSGSGSGSGTEEIVSGSGSGSGTEEIVSGSGSGSGTEDIVSGSGSGSDTVSGSGSGSDIVSGSGSGSDIVSGSGSGSGTDSLEENDLLESKGNNLDKDNAQEKADDDKEELNKEPAEKQTDQTEDISNKEDDADDSEADADYDDEYDYDDEEYNDEEEEYDDEVDSASEKDEDYDDYKDDWEGFWENLGNDNTSDSDMFEESSTSSYMTTEKNDWTEDDYDYEDEYSEEAAAGKDMMESAHHFDSNLGVFAGAKVYHKQTTSRPSSNIRQYDDEEDSSFMSSYTLILLLSTVGIIFLVVVFMHKHKCRPRSDSSYRSCLIRVCTVGFVKQVFSSYALVLLLCTTSAIFFVVVFMHKH